MILDTITTIAIIIGVPICAAFTAALIILASEFWKSYRLLSRSKVTHGPKTLPFIGNLHCLWGKTTSDIFRKMLTVINTHESPMRVWMGPRVVFGVQDVDHIKSVLANSEAINKISAYDLLKPWLGEGLLTGTGSIWKRHRKVIQPAFNTKTIETFIEIFARKALLMAEKIGMEAGNEKEFNVYPYMSRYSFDTICEATLGVSVHALENEDSTYSNHVQGLLETTYMRMLSPWLTPDFIFHRTALGKSDIKKIKYLNDFTQKIIIRARQKYEKELAENESQPRKSIMGHFLSSTEDEIRFTDSEIHDEVSTVIVTGYDTTANLLNHTMYILANYPEIQDKVYAELCEIYGAHNSDTKLEFTLQDLNRMEYLDRVLKETMRLFPAALILGRHVMQDIQLGEHILPAGSDVLLGFFTIHRSEKYWPSPLEVNPDRFLPNHPMGPRNPSAYIPFSAGTRNCIGMKYANISVKTVLSTLIWKYHFKRKRRTEIKDVELVTNVTVKPKDPITMYVERRCAVSG